MNKKRHKDFINLKHKIENSTDKSIESLRQVVIRFNKENKEKYYDDCTDLLCLFLQKEEELNPQHLYI